MSEEQKSEVQAKVVTVTFRDVGEDGVKETTVTLSQANALGLTVNLLRQLFGPKSEQMGQFILAIGAELEVLNGQDQS